MNRVL